MKLWPYLASSEEVLSCLVWPSFVFDSPRDHYFAVSLLLRRQASFVQLIKRSRRKQRLFLLDKRKMRVISKYYFQMCLLGSFHYKMIKFVYLTESFRGGEKSISRVWLNCSIYDFRCGERGGKTALFQVFSYIVIKSTPPLIFCQQIAIVIFNLSWKLHIKLQQSNTG